MKKHCHFTKVSSVSHGDDAENLFLISACDFQPILLMNWGEIK